MAKFLPIIMPTSFDINGLQCFARRLFQQNFVLLNKLEVSFLEFLSIPSYVIQTVFHYQIKILATNRQSTHLFGLLSDVVFFGVRDSEPHLCKISYYTNFSHHIFHCPPTCTLWIIHDQNLVTMALACSQVVGSNPISPTTAVYWWRFSVCMPETKLKSQVYIHIFPTLPLSMILYLWRSSVSKNFTCPCPRD